MNILSRIASLFAIALIAAPICLAAFNPQIPIWFAILLAAILGTPVLLISFRLGKPNASDRHDLRFWPTQAEKWGMLGLLAYFGAMLLPVLFFMPLFLLVPDGDTFPIVTVRLLLATLAGSLSWWWIPFAKKRLPELFRGKLSDAMIDGFKKEESLPEPCGIREALLRNWGLPLLALFAFMIVGGVLNLNNFVLRPINGGGRGAKWIRILIWCQTHPNTVRAAAAMVGILCMTLFAIRVNRAHARTADLTVGDAASIRADASSVGNGRVQ